MRSQVTALDRKDIQGIVASGYDHLDFARYVFLRMEDDRVESVRRWLDDEIIPRVTMAVHPGDNKKPRCLNIGFTRSGISKLVPGDVIKGFPYEFSMGMTRREADLILGDTGESASNNWEFGGPGQKLDLLLMIFADAEEALRGFADRICGQDACRRAGLVPEFEQDAVRKRHDPYEPFGFHDSISQPAVIGLTSSRRTVAEIDLVRPGEILLGYENEFDQVAPVPAVENWGDPKGYLPKHPEYPGEFRAFGLGGSYLAFRKLSQDVDGFWRYVCDHARQLGGNVAQERERLAAKLVGRWRSGAPLVLSPDNPGAHVTNDFLYFEMDPNGLRCPVGAHIRRANPRDSLPVPPLQSLRESRRHRIIRRGRKYRTPADSTPDRPKPADQGICFIALNANLRRQFEFLQQTWLDAPNFNGLDCDKDPIAGDNAGGPFTIQRKPVNQRLSGLQRFVTVKGGAYFLVLPMKALEYLAHYPFGPSCAHDGALSHQTAPGAGPR